MELYKLIKDTLTRFPYYISYKEDMIQDLWLKLRDRDGITPAYIMTCAKNYTIDTFKKYRYTELTYKNDCEDEFNPNLLDEIMIKCTDEELDMLVTFLNIGSWSKTSALYGMSDKTFKKKIVKILNKYIRD